MGTIPWKQQSVFGMVRPLLLAIRVIAECWCAQLRLRTVVDLNDSYACMVEEQFGESVDDINNSDLKIRFSPVKKMVPQKHKVVAHVKRADGSQHTHTPSTKRTKPLQIISVALSGPPGGHSEKSWSVSGKTWGTSICGQRCIQGNGPYSDRQRLT